MVEAVLDNLPLVLLAAGLVMMALEALSPGAHLVVIGVALVGAGLIGLVFPPAAAPLILAGLTLAFGAAAAYVYREFDFYGGKGTPQTKDSSSLAGTTGYATKPVTTRSGEVKLDRGGFAPYYSARTTSGTIEEGQEIIVLDPGGGNVVTVEALSAIESDEIDRALARETETESEGEIETAGESETVAGTETEGEIDTETEGQSETETETQTETETETQTESETETESNGDTATNSTIGVETDASAKSDAGSESNQSDTATQRQTPATAEPPDDSKRNSDSANDSTQAAATEPDRSPADTETDQSDEDTLTETERSR